MPRRRPAPAAVLTAVLAGVVLWGLVVGEATEGDRVEALGGRIRCPVCQGESIVDSPTPYARDILAFVEDRVAEGWTDEQILNYLEERFEGIRLDPRFSGSTVVLWLLPLAAGLCAVFLAGRRLIRPREASGD
ncbi:MAG: cytochrome c-type biogenesis protein CcmH [bacterium]|nr:cytochrome c-type biogenesis protein CcmH [bacterium]MDE0290602.1 cytochrome c-type biogenesis protein CcmH [bacterium]MDE0439940.1 cytochrome c-type biogenesis protein CcmH [bacterium]